MNLPKRWTKFFLNKLLRGLGRTIVMEKTESEIATRASWKNLQFLSDRKSRINFERKFTKEEFEKLARGFVPQAMEDKWFVFLENDILYFHRSWTGFCIYRVHFKREGEHYKVSEVWANRDADQYKELSDEYDRQLLSFLIENLLLKNRVPFPIKKNLAGGYPKGVVQHSIAGTAYPEIEFEEKEN